MGNVITAFQKVSWLRRLMAFPLLKFEAGNFTYGMSA
jgi:hypothetical protein